MLYKILDLLTYLIISYGFSRILSGQKFVEHDFKFWILVIVGGTAIFIYKEVKNKKNN